MIESKKRLVYYYHKYLEGAVVATVLCVVGGEFMIRTSEISVDLGGKEILINIIENSEEVLTAAINDEETPVWVELWPCSLALARWLWNGPSLSGKSILELGAGLGLPGIVAGLKGADVLQTDYIADALTVIKSNAVLNNIHGLRTAVADWRDFNISETFDSIIGSDILYNPGLTPHLKQIFQRNLRPGGKIVMADAGRKNSITFIQELISEGWKVSEEYLEVSQGRFNYRISVFLIQPPD